MNENEYSIFEKFQNSYFYFLRGSLLFAAIYTFSMYKNNGGIMPMIAVFAALVLFHFAVKKINIDTSGNLRKSIYCYYTVISIIGINLFYTADTVIRILDSVGIILLLLVLALKLFYPKNNWGIISYLSNSISVFVSSFFIGFLSITDRPKEEQNEKKNYNKSVFAKILLGILLAIPLMLVVCMLLRSADLIFDNVMNDILFKVLKVIGDVVSFRYGDCIILLVASFLFGYGFIRNLCMNKKCEVMNNAEKYEPIVISTVCFCLSIVYLIFSWIQIMGLFIGKMTLPGDYTYAGYAREGFFQLVVVCFFNLILIWACNAIVKESKFLKFVLVVISVCTYIMIASSTMRMIMYVKAYQLSYTRLFVFFGLVVMFMLMNGSVINIFNKNINMMKYMLVVVSVGWIIFSFMKPESMVARVNLSEQRCNEGYERIDFDYINEMGSDAASVIENAIKRENNPEFTENLENYTSQEFLSNDIRKFCISDLIAYYVVK